MAFIAKGFSTLCNRMVILSASRIWPYMMEDEKKRWISFIHDTKSCILPAEKVMKKYPSIQRFCGDAGYRHSFELAILKHFGIGVDISKRIKPTFEVLPKRWVVERTFAWVNHSRRLSKNYEIKSIFAVNIFIISHLFTLLNVTEYWLLIL